MPGTDTTPPADSPPQGRTGSNWIDSASWRSRAEKIGYLIGMGSTKRIGETLDQVATAQLWAEHKRAYGDLAGSPEDAEDMGHLVGGHLEEHHHYASSPKDSKKNPVGKALPYLVTAGLAAGAAQYFTGGIPLPVDIDTEGVLELIP